MPDCPGCIQAPLTPAPGVIGRTAFSPNLNVEVLTPVPGKMALFFFLIQVIADVIS